MFHCVKREYRAENLIQCTHIDRLEIPKTYSPGLKEIVKILIKNYFFCHKQYRIDDYKLNIKLVLSYFTDGKT